MAFQECPGILQLEVFFTQQGQRVENVFHMKQDGPYTNVAVADLVGDLQNWATTEWPLVAQTGAAVVGGRGVDLSTEVGATAEFTLAEPVPGTLAGTNVPMNSTVAVSWHTALRGRSYRGRTFHVGLSSAQFVDSQLTVVAIAALIYSYNRLKTIMNVGTARMAVLSRRHGGVLRAVGVGTDITTVTVNGALDSQRRRLPERGA